MSIETARKFDDGGIKRDDQALAVIEKYTQVPPQTTHHYLESLNDQQSYYLHNGLVDYHQQPVRWTSTSTTATSTTRCNGSAAEGF